MKVSLFITNLLLTTSFAAFADVEYFTITTNFENNTKPTTSFGGVDHIVTGDTSIAWLLTSFKEEDALRTDAWGQNDKNFISPQDVGKGAEMMMTFHNTVNVKEPFELTGASFTYLVTLPDVVNEAGETTTTGGGIIADKAARTVAWTLQISSLETGELLLAMTEESTIKSGWQNTKHIEFEFDNAVSITGDYVVTITARNPSFREDMGLDELFAAVNSQPSAAYGLQTISFAAQTSEQPTPPTTPVPEPTTATLSLLALAGLAARRRRKGGAPRAQGSRRQSLCRKGLSFSAIFVSGIKRFWYSPCFSPAPMLSCRHAHCPFHACLRLPRHWCGGQPRP